MNMIHGLLQMADLVKHERFLFDERTNCGSFACANKLQYAESFEGKT
jgi:hypothetical protein